jgi:hypothetical protein
MAGSLFRNEALEQTTAGERYEDMFVVVSSRAWAALAAVGLMLVAILVWSVTASIPVTVDGSGEIVAGSGLETLAAPADGIIIDERDAGETIARGTAVIRLRTAAGLIAVARAPFAGTVIEIPHEQSAFVHRGDIVATIEPPPQTLRAVVFLPVAIDSPLLAGMAARISPIDANPKVFGIIRGTVTFVAPYPVTPERIASVLHNATLAAGVETQPLREVHISLSRDASGEPRWSGGARNRPRVASGTLCSAGVVVEMRKPIAFVFAPLR